MQMTAIVIIILLIVGRVVTAIETTTATTCLDWMQLAGIILGCIFGTIVIAVVVTLAIWRMMKTPRSDDKSIVVDKSSNGTDNRAYDVEDKSAAMTPPLRPLRPKKTRDQATSNDTLQSRAKQRHSLFERSSRKPTYECQSTETLNRYNDQITVALQSRNANGLGFTIDGNMSDGVFIRELLPHGVAQATGMVSVDDRIRSVTIDFTHIVYEDALTILSYASPYHVELELERNVVTNKQHHHSHRPLTTTRAVRIHPLFRSQSARILNTKSIPTDRIDRDARADHIEARRAISLQTPNQFSPISSSSMTISDNNSHLSSPIAVDPYANLSDADKLQIMQLSFDNDGDMAVIEIASDDADSLPDVDAIRNRLHQSQQQAAGRIMPQPSSAIGVTNRQPVDRSAPTRGHGAPPLLQQQDSLDKEQMTKLLYNQTYLLKQQEELAQMGINVQLNVLPPQ